jgi:2-isopropylmalate synthase
MGVDVIEAGFPISSNGDFESVEAIAGEISSSTSAGWPAARPRTSSAPGRSRQKGGQSAHPRFLRHQQNPSRSQTEKGEGGDPETGVASIQQARQYTKDDVEFSPEDASRTELEFLEEITQAAVEAGATTINLPDTVGYATPRGYGQIFSHLLNKLPILREEDRILSCHCHDDLGLAVANSLSAVENGARQVECTINGIGERAGNAALEEIVMALRTRGDFYKIGTKHRRDEDLSRPAAWSAR